MPTEPRDRVEVDVSSRRTVILIAAVAVGLLAAFALVTYVGGVEDEASAGAQRVPVVRVARDIPRGLTGREAREQGYLEEAAIAAEFRPASAMVDLAAIDLNVAGTDLAAGQVLVDGMFVDPAAAQLTAARRVPEGEVAITVSVDQVRGVAGLISPGDKITVFILDPVLAGAEGEPGGAASRTPVLASNARSFFQGVEVLYIDRTPVALPGEAPAEPVEGEVAVAAPANSGLITLAVPRVSAQMFASVLPENLYFALEAEGLGPEALPPIPVGDDTLPAEPGGVLTPYGSDGRPEETTP